MNSAREHKLKNCIANNLNVYDVSNSKTKRCNSKLDKGPLASNLLSSSMSPSHKKKNLKVASTANPKKLNLLIKETMKTTLHKHNTDLKKYYIKLVNDIIYDERKHIVCLFKDYLIWDENSDFLKRFYFTSESSSRIPKICAYYEKYSVMKPIYFKLTCNKIMQKNVKKQKRFLELMEENEERAQQEEECHKNDISEHSKLIKTSLMEERFVHDEDRNKVKGQYKNEHDNSSIIIESIQNLKNFKTINQYSDNDSFSYIFHDHLNTSNNFSLYSQYNKLNFNNESEVLSSAKSKNCYVKTQPGHLNSNTKEVAKGKVTLMIPINTIKTNINQISQEALKTIDSPRNRIQNSNTVFKKIEFNKLDLKNINEQINRKPSPSKHQEELTTLSSVKFKAATARNSNKPMISQSPFVTTTPTSTSRKPTIIEIMKTLPDTVKHFNRLNTKEIVINTNEIKKRFNLVQNAVRTLKNTQKKTPLVNNMNNKPKSNFVNNNNGSMKLSKEKSNKVLSNVVSHNHLPSNPGTSNSKRTNNNAVIKTNIQTAKNMLNEHTNSVVSKYLSNNHSKQNSQIDAQSKLANAFRSITGNLNSNSNSQVKNSNNNNNPTSSVYNINLNLNLNVNLNMLSKKNSTPSTNTSKGMTGDTIEKSSHQVPLTERPSIINNFTTTTSKIEKSEKHIPLDRNTISTIKANEKYKKISRNINVKNFILNYGSGNEASNPISQFDSNNLTNTTCKKTKVKNLIIATVSDLKTKIPATKEILKTIPSSNKISSKTSPKNNLQFYSKKFIASNTINNEGCSSQKVSPSTKKMFLNLNGLTGGTITSISNAPLTMTNNTFNQRNVTDQNSQKKPALINIKKSQFETIKEIANKYSLTSRNEKDSIKIFSHI